MTWLAKYLSGRDNEPTPVREPPGRRRLREKHEEFVVHERAIAETQRLRDELAKELGRKSTEVVPWWDA